MAKFARVGESKQDLFMLRGAIPLSLRETCYRCVTVAKGGNQNQMAISSDGLHPSEG